MKEDISDEEIADSMLIPTDLEEEEKQQADEEIRVFRQKMLREQTEENRIYSDLMRFRFQIEDYIDNQNFVYEKSFGKHLEEYARILKRTKRSLSEDLGVHYTRLSRIINEREEPNIELAYRLEKHSGKLISALLWWKLIMKKQEHIIKKDIKTKNRESAKVRNAVKGR